MASSRVYSHFPSNLNAIPTRASRSILCGAPGLRGGSPRINSHLFQQSKNSGMGSPVFINSRVSLRSPSLASGWVKASNIYLAANSSLVGSQGFSRSGASSGASLHRRGKSANSGITSTLPFNTSSMTLSRTGSSLFCLCFGLLGLALAFLLISPTGNKLGPPVHQRPALVE